MPKKHEYPTQPLDKCIKLCESVRQIGSGCSKIDFCKKTNQSLSGSLQNTLSSAVKYGLITIEKKNIHLTKKWEEIELAYFKEEKIDHYQTIIYSVYLFEKLINQFNFQTVPIELLPKILIKEYQVEHHLAKKLCSVIIKNFKLSELLNSNDQLNFRKTILTQTKKEIITKEKPQPSLSKKYNIKLNGPSINIELELTSKEDIECIEKILDQLKKKLY